MNKTMRIPHRLVPRRWIAALLILPGLGVGGVAAAHDAPGARQPQPARTISIRMDDAMRFYPDRLEVAKGETIRLRVLNTGRMAHELVLGEASALLAHAEAMRMQPDMPPHHEANAVTVAPGQAGEIVWTFPRTGTVDFACLLPGHYEAGMTGKIEVVKR